MVLNWTLCPFYVLADCPPPENHVLQGLCINRKRISKCVRKIGNKEKPHLSMYTSKATAIPPSTRHIKRRKKLSQYSYMKIHNEYGSDNREENSRKPDFCGFHFNSSVKNSYLLQDSSTRSSSQFPMGQPALTKIRSSFGSNLKSFERTAWK